MKKTYLILILVLSFIPISIMAENLVPTKDLYFGIKLGTNMSTNTTGKGLLLGYDGGINVTCKPIKDFLPLKCELNYFHVNTNYVYTPFDETETVYPDIITNNVWQIIQLAVLAKISFFPDIINNTYFLFGPSLDTQIRSVIEESNGDGTILSIYYGGIQFIGSIVLEFSKEFVLEKGDYFTLDLVIDIPVIENEWFFRGTIPYGIISLSLGYSM